MSIYFSGLRLALCERDPCEGQILILAKGRRAAPEMAQGLGDHDQNLNDFCYEVS